MKVLIFFSILALTSANSYAQADNRGLNVGICDYIQDGGSEIKIKITVPFIVKENIVAAFFTDIPNMINFSTTGFVSSASSDGFNLGHASVSNDGKIFYLTQINFDKNHIYLGSADHIFRFDDTNYNIVGLQSTRFDNSGHQISSMNCSDFHKLQPDH